MKNAWIIVAVFVVLIGGFLVLTRGGDTEVSGDKVGTSIGNIAPDFSFTTIDGELVRSEDLRGQVVVITSSAAWCSTCVAEALQFASVYPSVKNKGVYFLTVDIDPNVTDEQIWQFQTQTVSPWAYASARSGKDIMNRLKLSRFEITYVINGDGVITFKDSVITSAPELEDAINEAL